MIYKSRKRKTEEAIKETFEAFAGTAITGVPVLLGRDLTIQEPTHIRIHCNTQEPTTDEDVTLLNFRVSGSITLQASMDDKTRDEVSELEGAIDSYIEQDSDTIVASLNDSTVDDFGCWEFQPESSEDDVDEENRRYLSVYGFSAIIGHSTY